MKIENVLRRWKKLKGRKSEYHEHFEDLARVMLPTRMGFSTTIVPGQRRNQDTFDGTPMQAARGLANAIGSLMRPQGFPEFGIVTDRDELNAQEESLVWLDDTKRRMLDAFSNPKARFLHSSSEKDRDVVVFGTGSMFIGETDTSLLFQTQHLKDVTPMFDEEGTAVGNFIYRKMTIRNAAAFFGGIEKMSRQTQERFKEEPDGNLDILHAVLPRKDATGGVLSQNMPFMDLWLEIDEKHKVKESGFHEFPFILPRFDTSSGEDMGYSPGMIALPDSDTLQAMGETILVAGQRAADPPLAVPNDGSFSAINTFPGGLAYYDADIAKELGGNPFFPIESATNLPISRDMQRDTRDQVFAAFFRNVLQLPVEGPQMTATEVIERKEEFIREIGPTFGKLDSDDTAPTVERVFMIMLRGGGFAPIPEILGGQNIRFEYESPAKKVRKQVEATAARLWAQEVIEMSAVRPEVLDRLNVDEYAKMSAEAKGIPHKLINSDETVQEIREGRAQQQAQAAEMDAIGQMAELSKTGADAANKMAQAEE